MDQEVLLTVVFLKPPVICIGPFYKGDKRDGIPLLPNEYMRVRDTVNGNEHVVVGPTVYFLGAYEQLVDTNPVKSEVLGIVKHIFSNLSQRTHRLSQSNG